MLTIDDEASTADKKKKTKKALVAHAGETRESREETASLSSSSSYTGVERARVLLKIVDKRSGVEERKEEFLTNERGEYVVKSLPLRTSIRDDDRKEEEEKEEDEREIVLSAEKEHYTFSSIRLVRYLSLSLLPSPRTFFFVF